MKKKVNLKIEYEVEVKDKKGKIIHKEKGLSKSLLKNFILWLHSKFTIDNIDTGGAAAWTAKDINNVTMGFPAPGTSEEGGWGTFGSPAADNTLGQVIGTGTGSVSPTDYDLDSRIGHGTGSGQMLYGVQSYEAVEVIGNASRFRITRVFTNNSGSSISVKEIGAIVGMWNDSAEEGHLLYLRDVLASPSSVPDGASLTLRYRFSVEA